MSSQPVDHLHPVLDFAHRLRERLDSVAKVPLWSMRPDEQREALTTLAQAEAQLDALKLRLLAEADRSGATTETGANTAADWLAVESAAGTPRRPLRPPPRRSPGPVRRARRGDGRRPGQHRPGPRHRGRTRQAAHHRRVRGQHRATAGRRDHLVALAEHHDAKALRILGGRIFEVIAPDLAEKFDGKALEAEEARALRRTTLTMWEDDEGTCHGRFRIPALHGQMLTKMILAISSLSRSTNDTASSGIDPGPAHPSPPRHRTHPADRDLPRREAAQDRWLLRHRGGHHDPRTAHRRPRPRRRVHPGHRRPHLRRRSATSRVHRRDHPRRPRREEPGPRRRPPTTTAHRVDAPSHGCARRRLHRSRAAKHHRACATPITTPPGLQGGRTSVEDRSPPLPPPPPPHPRPQVRDPTPARRQGQLPPTDLDTPGRFAEMSGAASTRANGIRGGVVTHVGNAHPHQPSCSNRDTMIPSGPRT